MKVYDRFADEYIDETAKDPFAPPERYIELSEELIPQNAVRWFFQALGKEQMMSEDLIKRSDAIQTAYQLRHKPNDAEWTEWLKSFNAIPSAEPKTDEENELKFYYVESIDDYWVGRRLDNFYYANWYKGLGFVWSHSRYLPWGKHIVDENTLWKKHTYPSEPIEIPFTEWIVGFVKKYFTEPKTGEWEFDTVIPIGGGAYSAGYRCSNCGANYFKVEGMSFCPNCGAKMKGGDDE